MRLTEKEHETLPIDVSDLYPVTVHFYLHSTIYWVYISDNEPFLLLQIVLQTLLSFVMTCYGIVHIAGEFKDMDASSELKTK